MKSIINDQHKPVIHITNGTEISKTNSVIDFSKGYSSNQFVDKHRQDRTGCIVQILT